MLLKQFLAEILFRFKTLTSRHDTKFVIGKFEARLPRGHRLPLLRKLYPKYDLYFVQFFRELNKLFTNGTVIDIGANFGDTTLEVLSAAPKFRSIAVEGAEQFFLNLELNTEIIRERVQIVKKFLYSSRIGELEYNSDLTTGGFKDSRVNKELVVASKKGGGESHDFISVDELLKMADGPVLVWKSDTDGFDVPILLENWSSIITRVDVIWIELHPHLPPTSLLDIKMLSDLFSESQFEGVLFDNYGCALGRGARKSLGELILYNCQKVSPKTRRLQKLPYYFDLVAFKSSIGSLETRECLIDSLLPGSAG